MSPVTDLRRYDTVLAELQRDDPALKYFPEHLPPTTKDAIFFYLPGYLQAPTVFRLRLILPPAEITAIEQRLPTELAVIDPDELHHFASSGVPPKIPPSTRTDSPFSGFEPFPDDCVSYLLAPDVKTAKENWNHPHNVGISISASRNEVIYWFN